MDYRNAVVPIDIIGFLGVYDHHSSDSPGKMKTQKSTQNSFVSHKELSQAFGLHPDTLKKAIKEILGKDYTPFQRNYSPKQLKKIYSELDNPFT